MGKSSGSAKKVNFFPVYASMRMSSTVTPLASSYVLVFFTLVTPNAKCRKPAASGREDLAGGLGKENSSRMNIPFSAKSNLYDFRSSGYTSRRISSPNIEV